MSSDVWAKTVGDSPKLHECQVILLAIDHIGLELSVKREIHLFVLALRSPGASEYQHDLVILPVMSQIILDGEPLTHKWDNTEILWPGTVRDFSLKHPHLIEDEEDMQVGVSVKILEYLVLNHTA